jgi:hypothetical protein
MSEPSNANSGGIKVIDALNLYFNEAGFPDSIRDELRKAIIDGVKNTLEQGGGIMLGTYGLEVYESDSEYYVDAAAFNYVAEQLRLKGVSGNSCSQKRQADECNIEGAAE